MAIFLRNDIFLGHPVDISISLEPSLILCLSFVLGSIDELFSRSIFCILCRAVDVLCGAVCGLVSPCSLSLCPPSLRCPGEDPRWPVDTARPGRVDTV